MIGQVLGHYRIESKLGEDGMGVVYRAHDETLDRDVPDADHRPVHQGSYDRDTNFNPFAV